MHLFKHSLPSSLGDSSHFCSWNSHFSALEILIFLHTSKTAQAVPLTVFFRLLLQQSENCILRLYQRALFLFCSEFLPREHQLFACKAALECLFPPFPAPIG